MKVFLATDYTVFIYNGRYYVLEKIYSIFKRYNIAFGKLVLCTRFVNKVPTQKHLDITDSIDSIIPVSLATSLFWLDNKKMSKGISECDLVVGRFDSIVSCRAGGIAHRMGKPFFAELMADAWDGYWNHGFIGKILAPYMYYANKKAVWNANYALYVTREFLQKRYPCKGKTTNASNVLIDSPLKDVLDKRLEKIDQMDLHHIKLATTANVDVVAKGHEYVIKALPELKKCGIEAEYYLMGGGNQERLLQLAIKNDVANQVVFLGNRSLEEVMECIDDIDIYIQPSLQEGLPRAIIEAMSRACPCIGSATAGIPELLSQDCIFKRKSSRDLVRVLTDVLEIAKLKRMATENFEKSGEYTDSILSKRRNDFYFMIKSEINKER